MKLPLLNVTTWKRFMSGSVGALLVAGLLTGCAKSPKKLAHFEADPVAALRARPVPFALKSRTTLWVEAPRWEVVGSTPASFLIHRPGRLLLTVQGPVGGVLLQAVSDGVAVGAYLPAQRRLLTAANAEEAIRELTGGALGLDGVLGVLVGTFPLTDPEVLSVSADNDVFLVRVAAPNDGVLEATVSKRRQLLKRLDVLGPDGTLRLKVSFEGFERLGRSMLPELVRLEVPSLDLKAEMRSMDWEEVGRLPVFEIPAPAGISAEDLIAEIRKTARAVSGGATTGSGADEAGD